MRILTTSNADDLEIAQRNKSTVSPTPMQKPADIVKALSNKFARMDSFGRSKAPVESTEEEREKDKEKAQQSSKSARASAQSALRSKKLQERIQEIIEKADVNKDGVIRLETLQCQNNGVQLECKKYLFFLLSEALKVWAYVDFTLHNYLLFNSY